MSEIKAVEKARVFISSLNRYKLGKRTLSQIRAGLVEEIERSFPFLSVDINEEWPAAGAGEPRKTTEERARGCHLFLAILVDAYGYQDTSGISASQIELEAALADSREKMLVFVQETLRDPAVLERQPDVYRQLLEGLLDYRQGKIVNWFSSEADLVASVLRSIELYCAETLRNIRRFPSYASSKTREETEWELMTFTERHERMMEALRSGAADLELAGGAVRSLRFRSEGDGFDLYELEVDAGEARQVPVMASACPDRFSYPDAARYVGYPFRTAMDGWKETMGPLHLISVFRTVTDTQIRRHLGNPDIHVSREGWGFFAADPERFIQVAYLASCTSRQRLLIRVRQLLAWLSDYGQVPALVDRAETRGKILRARI